MRIEVDGQHFDVPDDATPEEIDQITKPAPQDTHGMLAKGAHYAAKALPMAGGIAGGVLGGAGGAPSGIGAIATGAAGAGLGAAGGRALQHFIDQNLGYEQPMSNADAIKDTVGTGLKDAAMTGATGMGLEVASHALPMAANLARGGARAIEQRILTNKINPFGKGKSISPEALDEVANRGAYKLLGTSGGATKRIEGMREDLGNDYNRIVSGLEANGITGSDAQALAQKYLAAKQSASATTMNPAVPGIYDSAAQMVLSKPTTGGLLKLSQMEEMKRSAQGMARSAYKQLQPNEVGKAHEAVASTLRQAGEDEIAKQAANASPAVQDLAAQFVPAKQSLGNVIEASDLAREGMSRSKGRHFFSLTDWLAMSGEMAHSHNPVQALATGLATHALRSRGPSTAAVTLRGVQSLAEALSHTPQAVPFGAAVTGPAAAERIDLDALIAALRRKSSPVPQMAANDQ
jgi:hypothetical protein